MYLVGERVRDRGGVGGGGCRRGVTGAQAWLNLELSLNAFQHTKTYKTPFQIKHFIYFDK